ncbi:MAG: hypothetical protein DYG89_53725 [Caldilinea sp. CFX5]|nr:hypothetical protein [Caldilinea sp. CFX5]
MGSPNYRGEISQIIDEVFINYSLELPEEELASTSGYFMKGSPLRYSYFTVQRGAISQPEQTTMVYRIDPTNGNKTDDLLAALTWSSDGSKDASVGLITGYTLPKGWEKHLEPPYVSCYVTAASMRKRGIGRNQDDEIDLHTARIQDLDSAVLAIYLPTLPVGITADDLQVFINSHPAQQAAHNHAPGAVAPPPTPVAATFNPRINSMIIGAPDQRLQTGLYVVAKPIEPGDHAHNHATPQPVYDHHA